ncbi:MAG: glycosyltransferase [Aquincola tertiaricarbonis]|uniref:glycosyltransferase n=1 Tax=Aquincola tertiaricarbonis TaxID=391953 RepID=UPI000614ED76|nr:glycosyltransferase [Aquincola tertiaricarbonis]
MKVLHVESGRHLYGGALQAVLLMQGLQQRGHENHLACRIGAAIGPAAAQHGATVHETVMKGDVDVFTWWRLRRLIRQVRPDIVHLHARFGTDVWGALAARSEGVPVVHSRRVDNRERPFVVRHKYPLYDKVVAISHGIREVLLSEGVPPEQVVCVHSAVDTERYRPNEPRDADRAWFDAQFGLQPGDLAVALIAQFIPRKGHRVLVDAMPAVLAAQPRTKVVFLGQGPQVEPMKQLVAERGLQASVLFGGFRDDLHRVMPSLDLVVHPAATEGLGVSLLQAASCGVPIVATRAGGIPEIVQPGLNGELVQPGDAPALAAAMLKLLADEALRRHYGQAARQWVLDGFSTRSMVEGNLAVYHEVLARRGRRPA